MGRQLNHYFRRREHFTIAILVLTSFTSYHTLELVVCNVYVIWVRSVRRFALRTSRHFYVECGYLIDIIDICGTQGTYCRLIDVIMAEILFVAFNIHRKCVDP